MWYNWQDWSWYEMPTEAIEIICSLSFNLDHVCWFSLHVCYIVFHSHKGPGHYLFYRSASWSEFSLSIIIILLLWKITAAAGLVSPHTHVHTSTLYNRYVVQCHPMTFKVLTYTFLRFSLLLCRFSNSSSSTRVSCLPVFTLCCRMMYTSRPIIRTRIVMRSAPQRIAPTAITAFWVARKFRGW